MVSKFEELANQIIEEVCEVIENNYPIKPKSLTEDKIESPALINGTVYYNLENSIADKIKERTKKLMDLFRADLIDVCEDNEVMKKEIDLYFNDKIKELLDE